LTRTGGGVEPQAPGNSNPDSNLQGTVYITTNLSLQFNSLPSFQSSAPFHWPVYSECSQNENRIRPSCLAVPQICNQILL